MIGKFYKLILWCVHADICSHEWCTFYVQNNQQQHKHASNKMKTNQRENVKDIDKTTSIG